MWSPKQELELEDSKMWFVRFSLDRNASTLACGNRAGTVLLWDPHEPSSRPRARLKRTPGAKTTVRCADAPLCGTTALRTGGRPWCVGCCRHARMKQWRSTA